MSELYTHKKKQPIHLDPGLPPKLEHEKLVKIEQDNYSIIINMLKERQETLRTNAYQTKEDHISLINSQVSFIMLLRPHVDGKWLRHWLQWVEIIRDFKEQNAGYACYRSRVPTGLKDIKKGEPIWHYLQPEQIDATYVKKLNDMAFICENIPFFFEDILKFKFTELKQRARKKVLEGIRYVRGELDGIEKEDEPID